MQKSKRAKVKVVHAPLFHEFRENEWCKNAPLFDQFHRKGVVSGANTTFLLLKNPKIFGALRAPQIFAPLFTAFCRNGVLSGANTTFLLFKGPPGVAQIPPTGAINYFD